MTLRRLDFRGFTGNRRALREALPRPTDEQDRSSEAVAAIIAEVRSGGDEALRRLTRQFDGVDIDEIRVGESEIQAALSRIPVPLQEALDVAHDRILAYHAHESADPAAPDFESGGIEVRHLVRPVARAGCYAPGGRARYPSTVLMCAVPAQVAGVEEIVLCVPPGPDGRIDDASLAAAAVAGIHEVYRVGGAQAIAAMAYGTGTIEPVDVIVGPGNRYVAEAKRQVSGVVGVASAFAGPSEVVVVAGPGTPTELAAIDLVVQAEHGPDGLAWLVTWSEAVAEAVTAQVDRIVAASPRRADLEATLGAGGYVVLVDGPKQAMAVSNIVAPEHLEILTQDAASLLGQVTSAGAVFLGPSSPASVGDYLAGPNHVLPTNRTARFASALRVDDFRRHIHAVTVSEKALEVLGPHVVTLAETEGLPAHAESVRLRMAAVDDAGAAAPQLPPVRPDLVELTGYHSAQVDVEVRLNTNESPFPPPQGWLDEFRAALEDVDFNRYPDRQDTELRRALADTHGVRPGQVFCANGSNEVLQSLMLAYGGPGRTLALFEPTYTMHRQIARTTGTAVAAGHRTDDHRLDLDEVRRVIDADQPVLTFLCSPNNPSGRADTIDEIEAVLAMAPGLLVVDEAYGQFAPSSALELLRGHGPGSERVAVIRTFSKTWSMAGMRLGYLVAAPEVIRGCELVALPYHLDSVKQLAGRLALPYVREMEARVATLVEERGRIAATLADLPVESWPSDANFILFRPLTVPAKEVWTHLLDRSVLVRDCSEWPGLSGCLRVTVGLPEENDRFLAALDESLR